MKKLINKVKVFVQEKPLVAGIIVGAVIGLVLVVILF